MKTSIAIIGAGPAGMTAALYAARAGKEVTLIDGNAQVGRKLLVTGSGRANLTNRGVAPEKYASASDAKDWLSHLFGLFGPDDLLQMLNQMGLLTYSTADGWYYPVSESAQTVVTAFASALERAGVRLLLEHKVTAIRKIEGGFALTFEDSSELTCEKLLVAAGGKAYPTLGSRGECFPLIKALGHTVRPLLPALGPLSCEMKRYQKLQGVRLDAKVTLIEVGDGMPPAHAAGAGVPLQSGQEKNSEFFSCPESGEPNSPSGSISMPHPDKKSSLHLTGRANSCSPLPNSESFSSTGSYKGNDALSSVGHSMPPARAAGAGVPLRNEQASGSRSNAVPLRGDTVLAENTGNLIFTQWGLNGPAVMDLSHIVARRPGTRLELRLNFLPDHEDAVQKLINDHRNEAYPLAVIPCSSLPPKLAQFVLAQAGLKAETTLKQCSNRQLDTLMEWIIAFPVEVSGVRDFDTCQVTAGGVPVEEVDPLTMQSRLVPDLYLAGETLDVVGPCGGYNLQFAFSSGAAAGMGMAAED